MKDIKILVVEDDRSIANLISTTLKIHGYTYAWAATGNEAVAMCASLQPELILLDLGLPDIDGIEVIRTIRSWSTAMIIIISARGEDSDKIEALDNGADDYLTKPFSIDELLARIRAAARRLEFQAKRETENAVFVNGQLVIDKGSNLVSVAGEEIHLTPIEYKLLCLLADNVGKVLTHSFIISRIWGTGMETDIGSLRVYMNSLRKKISHKEAGEELIRTHIGIGYQMIRQEGSEDE